MTEDTPKSPRQPRRRRRPRKRTPGSGDGRPADTPGPNGGDANGADADAPRSDGPPIDAAAEGEGRRAEPQGSGDGGRRGGRTGERGGRSRSGRGSRAGGGRERGRTETRDDDRGGRARGPSETQGDDADDASPTETSERIEKASGKAGHANAEDEGVPVDECAFAEFELGEDLIRGIAAAGYRTPSPIQARTLPFALEGRDIVGQARTGTGKTAAFLVPAFQMLSDKPGPRVLVVVPTRELSVQVHEEAKSLGRFLGVRSIAIYGGDPMKRQLDDLKKDPKIIAATPGRLMDHMQRRTIRLDDLDMLILDEADRMFDLGFRDDIAKIMRGCPQRRQVMLFSATLSDEVLDLAAKYMTDPAQVFLAPDKMTVDEVDMSIFPIDPPLKTKLLIEVLRREKPERSIIFTRTKIGADRLAERLQKRGLEAQELHSGLPQKKRESILKRFREGKFPYLIATDVAARGIDIDDVSHVINYDIPENAEDYVHRIGRTARMGKSGRACTFVTRDDGQFLTAIEKLINKAIPEEGYEGFQYRVAQEKKPEVDEAPAEPTPRTLSSHLRRRPRG